MPDTWEFANFGGLGEEPSGDADRDGRSNGEEYEAATDPNDAADYLRISGVSINDSGITIRWQAKVGRVYAFYRSDDMSEGAWQLVQGGLTVEADGESTVVDPSAPEAGEMFYRIEAIAPAP